MTGTVTSQLKGVIPVQARGAGGHEETVASLIDTGFDGFLALPAQQIMGLGLPLDGMELVVLADGHEAILPVYRGAVRWHGRLTAVRILEIEGGALLGTALLHGSRLTMDLIEGGPVRIEPIAEA